MKAAILFVSLMMVISLSFATTPPKETTIDAGSFTETPGNFSYPDQLFYEDFESAPYPDFPAGWTQWIQNPSYTWYTVVSASGGNPTPCAECYWQTGNPQDEWAITPPIDATDYENCVLEFDNSGSIYWSSNATLHVWVDTDISDESMAEGDEVYVFPATGETNDWQVYHETIDLSALGYDHTTFYVGFNYLGDDGAFHNFDNVEVNADYNVAVQPMSLGKIKSLMR